MGISNFYKDTKPGGQVFALFLMFVVLMFVASGVLLLLSGGNPQSASTEVSLLSQGLAQLIMFLVPSCLFVLMFQGVRLLDYFHLSGDAVRGKSWIKGLCAAAIALLLMPLVDKISLWNEAWHFPAELGALESALRSAGEESERVLTAFLSQTSLSAFVLNLLLIALVPACCEELFFRGCLQQTLTKWFRNPHWAIFVTALVFSLMHGEFFALVPRMFLGVVLGYLFYGSRSMVVNMCAHFANNAVVVVCYYLYATGRIGWSPESMPPIQMWLMILMTVAAFALLAYVISGSLCGKKR